MKKILFIIVGIVVAYFVVAGILTTTGICPKYINVMPKVVEDGIENIKGPNDAQTWHLFCPFAEKAY